MFEACLLHAEEFWSRLLPTLLLYRICINQAEVLLCSNSENSAVTSQVDSCNVKEDSRSNSRPGCASEGHASLTRNAHDVSTKRMKLSADQLLYSRPDSGRILNSPTPLKGVVSSMSQTASQFVFHTESFATKLLVTRPSAILSKKSGSLQCAENRKKPSNIHEPNLFRAAGWGIGRHKRKDKVNAEFIYLSPHGRRTIREFRRAWNLCGEGLFAHRNVSVQEDGKQWTDMTDFCSDLSNALIKIEEELNNTETTAVLAHRWCLLDPFANTVFIDKKLGPLKVGKLVKTRRCFVIDTSTKDDAVMASENMDSIGRSERYSLDWLYDTSLVRESLLTKSEGNYHNCNEKLLDGISAEFGELHKGTVKKEVANQFKGSLDDHLNRKNDGLAQSNYRYTPYTSLSTQSDSVSCIPSPGKLSPLVYVDETDVMQYTGLIGKVSVQCLEASEFEMSGASSVAGAIFKRKMHKKSKKISEIKLATLSK
ncbi:hypothetical protein U1Q18_020746 [Sarracenia purpurea var. burkii]